jgi:diguanylate cyclase (GGDEF)-like protein/PAS domain S-box-containing protein
MAASLKERRKMDKRDETKEQLFNKLGKLRQRVAELEISDIELLGDEEQQRHSEKKFFKALRNSSDFIVITSLDDGRYIEVNDTFLQAIGYRREEIIGRTALELNVWADPQEREKFVQILREQGAVEDFEAGYHTKSGEVGWVLMSAKLIEIAAEQCILTVSKDVTEHKQMEEEHKKQQEHLRELVEERTAELKAINEQLQREIGERNRAEEALRSSQSDLQAKNRSLKILNTIADKVYGSLDLKTVAERAVAVMMNYSQSPFVGIYALNEESRCLEALYSIGFSEEMRLRMQRLPLEGGLSGITVARKDIVTSEDIMHDDRVDLGIYKDLFKQGFRGIISIPLLFQDRVLGVINLIFKEKMPILANLGRETLLNMGKAIGLAMANARYVAQIENEIKERKKTEELLQRERETFNSTLQDAPHGVAMIDMNGRYLYINSEFTNITGYTLEDVPTGKEWFRKAYPNPKYRRGVIEAWKKNFARKIFEGEFSVVCKDGTVKEIDFRGTVLKNDRIIMTLSDITERIRTEGELQESESRYRTLFDSAADAIFVHDLKGKFHDVNSVACERYGYSKKEFLQMSTQDITTPGRKKGVSQRFEEIRKRGHFLYETVHLRRDGTIIPTEVSSQIIEYSGKPVILSIARDITERKQSEEALRQSEAWLRKLFEAIPEAVIVHDEEGNILHINDVGAKRLDWPMEELIGRNLREIVKAENAAIIPDHVRKARTNGSCSFETTYISRTGRHIVAEVNERPIELEGKNVILSVARDITERKRAERQLAHMATHDALTGLPNRVLFNDRLTLALAQAHRHQQKVAVMLLDLDRFKDINDTLGHSVGDQLLRVVSIRLKRLLRQSDTLARMGGDEFLFLVPDIARFENATEVAGKILASFREPFVVENHQLHTTASIGVTVYPSDGADADTLMKNADIAMYSAKQKGRNNYQRYISAMHIKTPQ